MLSRWSGQNNDGVHWPPLSNNQYVETKPWYSFLWRRSGTITKKKYNSIQIGMTREQVIEIIGGPPRSTVESAMNNHIISDIYLGHFWGSMSASFTYKNGVLTSKSEHHGGVPVSIFNGVVKPR